MLKFFYWFLSIFFKIAVDFRNFLYNSKIKKSIYFRNVFVISIGNLSVGGTGKTPHTEYIIDFLKDKYKIAFLSRGYRRKTKNFHYIEQKSTPEQVGDEPYQIYNKLGVTSAVCKDRIFAINKIIQDHSPQIIILDDAFQYKSLLPSVSILLTQYDRPFFKDHFLPFGRLRDSKHEYTRANIVIVTNCRENIAPIEKEIWKANIELKPYQKLFFSAVEYEKIVNENQEIHCIYELKSFDLLLFTGIANPQYIVNYYKDKVKSLKTILFSDHKAYTLKDIENIGTNFAAIKSENKIIVTTEKDYVKVKYLLLDFLKKHVYYQPIKINFLFNQKQELEETLLKRIENFYINQKKNYIC